MRAYKIAFFVVLVLALLFGGASAYLWFHPRVLATTPDAVAAPAQSPPESGEPKLLPVQLSPQRLQSIGVKTGIVEYKQLHDEIQTTGSVGVDETRVSH